MTLSRFVLAPAICADLFRDLVTTTVLHALHGRNANVVDPDQISLAETTLFAALAARCSIVGAILVAPATTEEIFLITRTVLNATDVLRDALGSITNKAIFAETSLEAFFVL